MLPESCRLTFLTTLTLVLSLTQVQAAPLCPLSSLGQVWCERSQSCLSIKDYLNSCLVNTSLRIPSTFDDNKTRLSEDVSKLEGSESEIYQTLKEAFEKIQERQSEEEETGTKRLQGSAVDSQRELPHSLIEENDTPLKSAAKFKESHDVAGTFNEWDVKTAQGLAISSKAEVVQECVNDERWCKSEQKCMPSSQNCPRCPTGTIYNEFSSSCIPQWF